MRRQTLMIHELRIDSFESYAI